MVLTLTETYLNTLLAVVFSKHCAVRPQGLSPGPVLHPLPKLAFGCKRAATLDIL